MNRLAFRFSLPVLILALSGGAYALGLGDLRGQPNLGDRLRLEVDIIGEGKASLDPACFRLVQPTGGSDLPWLKKAALSIRKGAPNVLEIRSETPLREPVLQIALQVACGNEISREYVLLASPRSEQPVPEKLTSRNDALSAPVTASVVPARKPRAVAPRTVDEVPRATPRKSERRSAAPFMPDRLMLSNGVDVGDPSLRLATELMTSVTGGKNAADASESQRDILRLEYRMLTAMNEQATTQLATAEKLRNMEATLGELQQKATDLAQRADKGVAPANAAATKAEPGSVPPVGNVSVAPPVSAAAAPENTDGLSEWSIYGVALGAVLGLAGWFGWRKYQERKDDFSQFGTSSSAHELIVDPKRHNEADGPAAVDLDIEPHATNFPMAVDLELDSDETHAEKSASVRAPLPETLDSQLSVSATTLDEHFEANPVMELADIMLSFGRVKGAAQALQEYIDNNPQEALQPWIRLMDVYRMAGMKNEFESVSQNLNQNFNVEIQKWGGTEAADGSPKLDLVLDDETPAEIPGLPVAPRPECLEDMPRLMSTVCEMWPAGDVVGYLYQLLRDNRGGQRVGFALPVVEEVLFLIELKETALRMEK